MVTNNLDQINNEISKSTLHLNYERMLNHKLVPSFILQRMIISLNQYIINNLHTLNSLKTEYYDSLKRSIGEKCANRSSETFELIITELSFFKNGHLLNPIRTNSYSSDFTINDVMIEFKTNNINFSEKNHFHVYVNKESISQGKTFIIMFNDCFVYIPNIKKVDFTIGNSTNSWRNKVRINSSLSQLKKFDKLEYLQKYLQKSLVSDNINDVNLSSSKFKEDSYSYDGARQ